MKSRHHMSIILGVHWHDFARNADVHHVTNQPPLSFIVKSCRLSSVWHIMRMDENADSSQVVLEPFARAGDVHLDSCLLSG